MATVEKHVISELNDFKKWILQNCLHQSTDKQQPFTRGETKIIYN